MRKHSLLLVSCRRQAILTTAIKKILGVALVCLCFAAQAMGIDQDQQEKMRYITVDGKIVAVTSTTPMPVANIAIPATSAEPDPDPAVVEFEVENDDEVSIKYLVTATGAEPGENTVAVVARTPKYSGVVNIPATVTHGEVEYSVTSIGGGYVTPWASADGAFEGCSSLTSVTFPNTITSIGDYAFTSCKSLISITFPNSITSIGNYAFMGCRSLVSVNIPESVTYIGWQSFDFCSSLASITIPASVTEIGGHAFAGCTSLTAITVADDNPNYIAEDGVLFSLSKTELIQYPAGKTGNNYVIPSTVTLIQDYAFYGCHRLASITIPDLVTYIRDLTFYECYGLVSITIPSSVTTIGDWAFWYCISLSSIEMKWDNLTIITVAYEAFSGTFPDGTYVDFDYTNCTIIVPVDKVADYRATAIWGQFGTIMEKEATPFTLSHTSLSFDGNEPAAQTVTLMNGDDEWSVTDNAEWLTATKDEGEGNTFTVTAETNTGGVREARINVSNGSVSKSILASQSAASFEEGGVKYAITSPSDNTVAVTAKDGGYSGAITIPSIVTHSGVTYNVTSIEGTAFQNCTELTSVTIPNSVTSIELSSFYGCSSLISIIIPESVTSIGNLAFYDCSSLTSITIPNSVTSIGRFAFAGCTSLTSIIIPESVSSIGNYALESCHNLTTIEVEWETPIFIDLLSTDNYANCTLIVPNGRKTFYEAVQPWSQFGTIMEKGATPFTLSPTSLSFEGNAPAAQTVTVTDGGEWSVTDNAEWLMATKTTETSFTVTAVTNPGGAREALISVSNSSTTKSIRASQAVASFEEGGITYTVLSNNTVAVSSVDNTLNGAITIPSTVTPSGGTACNVTSIGNRAFQNCSGLTSITIPESVTSIGEYVFDGCSSLTAINVNSENQNYASEDGGLFNKPKTSIIRCPEGKDSYDIPDGVTSIGDGAFRSCLNLMSITIPNSVTSVEYGAFHSCLSLTSITIPNSVTYIRGYAFQNCSNLTSITISDGVTYIGGSAFRDCSSLTTITIPASVTSIGEYAFSGCSSLTVIDVNSENLYYASADGGLFDKPKTSIIMCPEGKDSYDIPDGVTSIGNYAFLGCNSLASITIPNSVTTIGNHAFYDCNSLTSATIPISVTSIGDYAFYGCSDLTSIEVKWETPLTVSNLVLAGLDYTNCTLIVPVDKVELYRANTYWGQFVNIIEKSAAAAYIDVETTLSVAAVGETKTVTVEANVAWTVAVTEGNEDGEWLTATKVNETSFTVTATPNTDEIERTGEITVAGGDIEETITVTQAAEDVTPPADPYINVETTLSVAAAGETKTVTVDANVTWEVSTTDSWITATKVDETSFTVTASANTGGVRTGEITVAGGSVTQTIAVTQAAEDVTPPADPYINVETTLSVAAAGETKTVTVDANVTWEVSTTDGWLTATKVDDASFTVIAPANTGGVRTGEITVAGGDIEETITVTQAAEDVTPPADPYINVETTLSVAAAGETKTVTVDANVAWDVSTTDSWLTATKVDDASFTVIATANTGGVRTGEITVAGGSVTQTIAVTQAAEDVTPPADSYINVETTLSVAAAGETKTVTVDANVTWTVGVTDGDSWLTATKVDDASFTVIATANIGGVRTGEITVAGGSVTQTIAVTQSAAAVTPPPTPPTPPAPSVVYPTGVSLDLSSVTLKTGDTQQLVATVRPQNADNKNVTWVSDNTAVATVAGGVVTAVAAGTATITVTTAVGGYRATCTVTVEERNVVVEAPKPEGNKGVIEVSLNIPADGSFSCTFTITLPQGFVLDQSITALADDLKADYQLGITLLSGNTWQFDIRLKSSQNLRAATTYRNLVEVAYTIEESLPSGNHEVKLTNVELTMSDNTVIREDEIVVSVSTGSPTGIAKASADVAVRSEAGRLYINSPAAETVYIYSFTGKLLYSATKASGLVTFNAPSEKLLIVRGTSGWKAKLIIND